METLTSTTGHTYLKVPELMGCRGCIGEGSQYGELPGLPHEGNCSTLHDEGLSSCSRTHTIYIRPETLAAYVAARLEA